MKMAKWIVMAGLLPALTGTFDARAADQRIVFVNMQKCFDEFYKTKLSEAKLKDLADEYKNERARMVDDLKKLQDEFNKSKEDADNLALSEDARNKKRAEAEEKLVELREQESKIRKYEDSKQRNLDAERFRMRKRIVDEIRETLVAYARAQGYTAVLDSSGESVNFVPVTLYNDPSADITDAVISLVNKGKPADTPAAPK